MSSELIQTWSQTHPRVLVTGANGFVGSHLTARLVQAGCRVRCLVRRTSNLRFLQDLKVEYAHGDICEPGSLPAAVKDMEIVFHPAGLTKARTREMFFEVNQLGTRNLLEAVKAYAPGVRRFVHVSSQAAAGSSESEQPKTECDPATPVSAYGASKLAAEEEVLRFKDYFPVTIIRPPAVYGPQDDDILKFFQIARYGFDLRLGGREQMVSLVHITDLIECIVAAAADPRAVGELFFAANPEPHPVSEVMQRIGTALERRLITVTVPRPFAMTIAFLIEQAAAIIGRRPLVSRDKIRELSRKYWICSSAKAERLLGWRARITLEEGLMATYQWYRQAGWL